MDISKLVEQTKKGDNKSFDKLYKLTEKEIWFTCISFLKNETTAQDIMQETYITAFLKIQTLDKTAQFRSWLNRIAANKCKNYLKGKGEIELNDEILENSLVADEISLPEEYVTNKSKRECILSIMQKTLSDVQYQTVICFYFNEMSVEEIAELFECSKGTVLSRLNYSRAKMKTAIEKYEEENNDKLHGVVFVPLFSSIFKEQSKHIEVPEINLDFTKQGIKNITSKGAESAVKSGAKGAVSSVMKTRVIAMLCGMTVLCAGTISTGVLAGCTEEDLPIVTTASTVEVTTDPTEPTETVPQAVVDAVKENNLKVDSDGNITDSEGNKLEVNENGEVEVKNSDGTTTTIKATEVKDVVQNNGVVSTPTVKATEPAETTKATTKATQATTKATQATTKATQPTTKATQATTKATQPTTQKATQAPTQKATEAIWHPPVTETKVIHHEAVTHEEPIYETHSAYECNDCGSHFTDADSLMDHLDWEIDNGGKGSYRVVKTSVQVGTKTVVDKEAWDETVTVTIKDGYWEYK
ncbi:MAG: sigma-70 family RNA polymerase sigma factor [Ruminococcus sp.]